MKKLLIALLLTLSFTVNAALPVKYETKCIAGYMFAVVIVKKGQGSSYNTAVSMVQIYETGALASGKYPPQPMRCGKE